MTDAVVAVFVKNGADVVAGRADTRQVRCGRVALVADLQHGGQRAVTRGAAGAKGNGEKFGVELRQLLARGTQLGHAFRGTRREKLETEGTVTFCHGEL